MLTATTLVSWSISAGWRRDLGGFGEPNGAYAEGMQWLVPWERLPGASEGNGMNHPLHLPQCREQVGRFA